MSKVIGGVTDWAGLYDSVGENSTVDGERSPVPGRRSQCH